MQKRSDDTLVAYLDGELDSAERQHAEAWLAADGAARERLAGLAQSAASCAAPMPISSTSRFRNV